MKSNLDILRQKFEGDEPLTADEIEELRINTAVHTWTIMQIERHERLERPKRAAFLKDASPMDVLLWIMRSPTVDPRIQTDAAIALLPYLHPEFDGLSK